MLAKGSGCGSDGSPSRPVLRVLVSGQVKPAGSWPDGLGFRTPTLTTTWAGVPGESWSYVPGGLAFGRRVVATRWLADADDENGHRDAGDLFLKDASGDGRTSAFVEHDRVLIRGGTDGDADAYALQRLACQL